jgi:hypothetical protein
MENDPVYFGDGSPIQIVRPATELSFLDSQSVTLSHPMTALEAWRQIMGQPMPMIKWAFAIRDAVVSKFGVSGSVDFQERFRGRSRLGRSWISLWWSTSAIRF